MDQKWPKTPKKGQKTPFLGVWAVTPLRFAKNSQKWPFFVFFEPFLSSHEKQLFFITIEYIQFLYIN